MRYRIHMDGGARGNPGPAAVGISICDARTGQPVHEAGYFLGTTTNNVAEYQGLIRALERAEALGAASVELFSDSELMVRQITGQYRVKSAELKPLYERARAALGRIGDWRIEHVRRERNRRADELANRAMDAGRDVVVRDGEGGADACDEPADEPDAAEAAVRWKAKLMRGDRACVADQVPGQVFAFGPTTPEGFCVHGAAAVLAEGPLSWPAERQSGRVWCGRCGGSIAIKRVEDY